MIATDPLDSGRQPRRHRVSLILLAYNQARTARAAALSCLAQDCEPLEIVLSDDASTDQTYDILSEVAREYAGPHKVSARRNARNLGIGAHYTQLLAATSGELLINAAGDDLSLPQRARRLIEAWDSTGGRADLIASHVIDIDDEDVLHGVMRVDDLSSYRGVEDWAARRPYIIGAGQAFTRRMMDRFGPMAPEVFYEDQIMVFRAIVGGGAITVDEPLVHYRRGGTSRRPRFDSPEHLVSWTYRQCRRELAEMEQLISDARIAGCDTFVHARLAEPLKKARYLRRLFEAKTPRESWTAFREASPLPRWWRLRKLLLTVVPRTTFAVKRGLSVLHRRQH